MSSGKLWAALVVVLVLGSAGCDSESTTDAGMQDGGECLAAMCTAPPASVCVGETVLRIYEGAGACLEGACSYAATDVTCSAACVAGACEGEPCAGVACDAAPPPSCSDTMTLRTFGGGTCTDGSCAYTATEVTCGSGCVDGACAGEPCAGVTCDAPPPASCLDPMTLRTFASLGTCNEGGCSYASADVTCSTACAAGACTGEPCAGVMCDAPPTPRCVDTGTLRTFGDGFCSSGDCAYVATDEPCAFGCADGGCVPAFPFEPSNGVRWLQGTDAARTTTLAGSCVIDEGRIACDGIPVRGTGILGVENGIGWELLDPVAEDCTGTDHPAPDISVFSFGRLVVEPGATVVIPTDARAVALIALEMDIAGVISAEQGAGPGSPRGISSTLFQVGAGGATPGGLPGSGPSDEWERGPMLSPQFEPLCGGSAVLGSSLDGRGGGALMLVAATRIGLSGTDCGVRAVGLKGDPRFGGGPSGGTVSVEAPEVTGAPSCVISATGAGGNGGATVALDGELGESGQPTRGGQGGRGAVGGGGDGGRGGDDAPAQDGLPGTGEAEPGAGGGAAGFIRVRTTACPSSISAVPAATCEEI